MADMRHYDGVDSYLYSLIHHANYNANQHTSQQRSSQVGTQFQRDTIFPHANDNYLSFSEPPNRSNQIRPNIQPLFPPNNIPYNRNAPNYGSSLIVNNTRNYYDDPRPRTNRFYNAGNPPPSYNSRYKWGAQNRPAHPNFNINVPYNAQPIIQQFNQPVYHFDRNSRSRFREDPYSRIPPLMPGGPRGNRGNSRDSTSSRGNSRDSTKNRGNSREPTRGRGGNSRGSTRGRGGNSKESSNANKRKIDQPKNSSPIQNKRQLNHNKPEQTNSKNQTEKSKSIQETDKVPETQTISSTKETQAVATGSGNTLLDTVVTENNIDSFYTIDKGPTEDKNTHTAGQKEPLLDSITSSGVDQQTECSPAELLPEIEVPTRATILNNIITPQKNSETGNNKQKKVSTEKKKRRQRKSKSPRVQGIQRCLKEISTTNVLNASTGLNDSDVVLIPVVIPHIDLDSDTSSESDVVEIPKTPAPLVVISDSEAEGIPSEAETIPSQTPTKATENDEIIFATPTSKQKKRKKKKKSIDPPSRISTPDSNDFMGNDLENLDLNTEPTELEQVEQETVGELPYNAYETEESSCCSDWCGPTTETPKPTENLNQTNENRYKELDLVTFENLITPNRDDKTNKGNQSTKNISENVTNVSFSGNNSHKIIATTSNQKNTSDSSSESSDNENHSKELNKAFRAPTPQKSKQFQTGNWNQESSQPSVTTKSHTDSQIYAWNLLDDPQATKEFETSVVAEEELISPNKPNKKRKKRRSDREEGELSFTASEAGNQSEVTDTGSAKKSNKTHTDSQLFVWNMSDDPTSSTNLETSSVTETAIPNQDKTTKKRKKRYSEKDGGETSLNESEIVADQSEYPDTDNNISRNTTLNEADISSMTVVATKKSKKKKKRCKETAMEDETVIEAEPVMEEEESTTITKKKSKKRNSSGKVLNESAQIPEEKVPDGKFFIYFLLTFKCFIMLCCTCLFERYRQIPLP